MTDAIIEAKPQHEITYQELCDLLNMRAPELSALELLAVAANMVGKLIAMQDQRKVSPEFAMEIVIHNIKIGNEQIFNLLDSPRGSA